MTARLWLITAAAGIAGAVIGFVVLLLADRDDELNTPPPRGAPHPMQTSWNFDRIEIVDSVHPSDPQIVERLRRQVHDGMLRRQR